MRKANIIIAVTLICAVVLLFVAGVYWLRTVSSLFPPNAPAPKEPTNLESYLKVASIGLTLLVSVITAMIALVNVIIQVTMAREIEKLKPLLTLQYSAYKELNGAALGLFDALSRLQNETYQKDLAMICDQKMTEASGTLLFMPTEYMETWIAFQARARYSKEHADACIDALSRGEEYKLVVMDDDGTVSHEYLNLKTQASVWMLLQPKLFDCYQRLRKVTPH